MKSTFNDIGSLITRWINRYYELLLKEPKVRSTHETHLQFANQINEAYLKDLAKHYKRQLIEPEDFHQEAFKKQIDFLTGIYKREAELEARKELQNKLKSIPNRHYKPV